MNNAPSSDGSHFHGSVTQKAIIFNGDEEVLLVSPTVGRGWTLPGGRLQEGETTAASLSREIDEETGLSIQVGPPVNAMTGLWFTDEGEPMFTVVYVCESNETSVTLSEEHDAFE